MKRRHFPARRLSGRQRAGGFSLIELMTAMLLSMLLIAAAVSVFVSNKRIYGATEGLGRLQENARIAFELMSRDIREAGGNPCDVRMKVVNVLADTTNWWAAYDADTDTGIFGYDNGGLTGSTAGTDAIQIQFFEDTGVVTSAGMGSTTGALAVDEIDKFADKQILMACGFFPASGTEPVTDTAAIFSAGKSASSLAHDVGSGNASGNFSDTAHPISVVYPANTLLGSLRAMQWYVAANGQGKNSLYRRQLRYPGTAPEMGDAEEVVNDVTGLNLIYQDKNGAWTTGLPSSWNNVTAVQVELELEAGDNRAGGVEGAMIKRKLSHVIALRNKL